MTIKYTGTYILRSIILLCEQATARFARRHRIITINCLSSIRDSPTACFLALKLFVEEGTTDRHKEQGRCSHSINYLLQFWSEGGGIWTATLRLEHLPPPLLFDAMLCIIDQQYIADNTETFVYYSCRRVCCGHYTRPLPWKPPPPPRASAGIPAWQIFLVYYTPVSIYSIYTYIYYDKYISSKYRYIYIQYLDARLDETW